MTSHHVSEESVLQTVSQGRRRLVLQMYVSLAAVVLVFGFAQADWWFLVTLLPLMYAFALYVKLVTPIIKELTVKGDPELDERQLVVRDRAYGRAYRILAAVLLSIVLYAMLAALPGLLGGAGLPMPKTTSDFTLLILLFAHLVVSLPASVVAWTEPDPPISEEN